MRAFVAVDLEDPGVRSRLEAVQRVLKRTGAVMKLVEPRNFHVTLKFLGEIDESLVPRIESALRQAIVMRPFSAELRGLGAFPNPYRPRVVFVSIPSRELAELMRLVDEALSGIGFERETRPYTPHLTLARVKARGYLLSDVIEEYSDEEFGAIRVEEIRLKRSKLTPEGPIYSTVFSLKIGGEERRHITPRRFRSRPDRPDF